MVETGPAYHQSQTTLYSFFHPYTQPQASSIRRHAPAPTGTLSHLLAHNQSLCTTSYLEIADALLGDKPVSAHDLAKAPSSHSTSSTESEVSRSAIEPESHISLTNTLIDAHTGASSMLHQSTTQSKQAAGWSSFDPILIDDGSSQPAEAPSSPKSHSGDLHTALKMRPLQMLKRKRPSPTREPHPASGAYVHLSDEDSHEAQKPPIRLNNPLRSEGLHSSSLSTLARTPPIDTPSSSLSNLTRTPSIDTPMKLRIDPPGAPGNDLAVPASSGIIRSSQSEEDEEVVSGLEEVMDESQHGDNMSEASDSSLDDIDTILGKKKEKTSEVKAESISESMVDLGMKTNRTPRPGFGQLPPAQYKFDSREVAFTPPPRANYKFSLAKMLAKNKKADLAQVKIIEARRFLDHPDPESEDMANGKVDASFLSTVIGSEGVEDHGQPSARLMQAMARAEVMQTEAVWQFFELSHESKDWFPPDFPEIEIKNDSWLACMTNADFRSHAFLTGFVRESLPSSNCPGKLLKWLWVAAITEPREDLSCAYVDALESCRERMEAFLTPELITTAFSKLGLTANTSNTSQMSPVHVSRHAPIPRAPARLSRLVRAIHQLSHCMRVDSIKVSLKLLLRTGIDWSVSSSSNMKLLCQDCVTGLISNLAQDKADEVLLDVFKDIESSIKDLALRQRMLNFLPDLNARLQSRKRSLGLSWFLEDTAVMQISTQESSALWRRVINQLQSHSHFDINDNNLDYRSLTASISMLDIGVAGGFTRADASQDGNESEAEFNANVDDLSQEIHRMFTRIRDVGASDLARTESKAALEKLMYRLDYGVRTRLKPKKNVYGAVMEQRGKAIGSQAQLNLMKAWVSKKSSLQDPLSATEDQEKRIPDMQ